MKMFVISSMCLTLNRRLNEISETLKTCTDEKRRASLLAEQKIKRDVQMSLLENAVEVKRTRKAKAV